MHGKLILLTMLIITMHVPARSNHFHIKDFENRLRKNYISTGSSIAPRIFDCIDSGNSPAPVSLAIKNPEFDYQKSYGSLRHFFGDYHGWPLVLSYLSENVDLPRTKIILPFRGDTFGYHKSFLTKPIIDYAQSAPENFLLFLGEFIYTKSPALSKEKPPSIMSLCHNRQYWFGYVGPEWPLLYQHGWSLLTELLTEEVPLEFIAYSNGTVSRNALLRRKARENFLSYAESNLSPEEYLAYYIRTHSTPAPQSKRIKNLIDIEGNFRVSNDLWDLIAFIKDQIMPEKKRTYYSIVRVDKPDAFPVNVLMIRALRLSGVETPDGILQFSNDSGNVMMEIIGRQGKFPYGVGKNDLLLVAPVQRYAGNITRKSVSHYGIIDFALRRKREK